MVDIITAINDEKLFKPVFRDLATWSSWKVFLKAITGLPLSAEELPLFQQCTGLDKPPEKPPREVFCICGRRSGKSFISGLLTVFFSCFRNWSEVLAPGERGYFAVIACDRRQAKVVFNYIRAFLHASPLIEGMISEEFKEEISLKTRIVIDVKTASYRTIRGFSLIGLVMDELAFFRSENSAEPDFEIYRAAIPALATTGGLLIGISTPYARRGLLWEKFSKHFGKPGETLIWQAPSRLMNPTLDEKLIEKSIAEDPEAGRAEWLAEWRQDLSSFLDLELIERAVVPGRYELPPMAGVRYAAFCDPSGGRGDAMTLSICHVDENEKIIQDVLLIKNPPFDPAQAAAEFSEVLKKYGIYQIRGDKYAGAWVSEAFRKNGIAYEPTDLNKSEIYLEFLPLLAQGRVELLDNKRLISELRNLERRTRTGGRDVVDHPVGLRDDAANSTAGSIVFAAKWSQPISIWFPGERDGEWRYSSGRGEDGK
jgi:hypothetical protein